MGMPVYQVHTTTGAKSAVSIDWTLAPCVFTIGIALGTSATYGIEFTLDDLTTNPAPAWIAAAAPLAPGATTAQVAAISFPVTGVRINITAISGPLQFKVLQGTHG